MRLYFVVLNAAKLCLLLACFAAVKLFGIQFNLGRQWTASHVSFADAPV